MTQTELARRVGVSNNTVTHWVQGRYEPDFGHLQRIAEALSMHPGALLADGTRADRLEVADDQPLLDQYFRLVAALADLDLQPALTAVAEVTPDLLRLLEDATALAKRATQPERPGSNGPL